MPKVPAGYLTERRRQILVAASAVFSRKGVQTATIADVAAEAGVSPGLIYRYFPSKEDLFTFCTSESAQEIEERWNAPPDGSADPLREFTELSHHTFEQLADPHEQSHTVLALEHILTAVRNADVAELHLTRENWRSIISKIEGRLEAAKTAGQLAPELDTSALASLLFAMYWGTRLTKLVDTDLDVNSHLETVMWLMDHGAAPGDSTTS